jgi:hypothetical protein
MNSGSLCMARTSKGYGCINQSKNGPFCPAHDRRNQCGAVTATGKGCRRMKSFGSDRCSKHQI